MERCLPRSGIIAILTKDTRQFAGRAALTPTPSPSEREIQVIISQHYWGRRFGREVSHILIEAAFDELGADQVVAVAHPENLASLNLLASFGFESDGTIQDGTWQNGHRRFTLSLANFLKSPGASLTE
jgi:RimJ/RimL family protein N-acetyltransferase